MTLPTAFLLAAYMVGVVTVLDILRPSVHLEHDRVGALAFALTWPLSLPLSAYLSWRDSRRETKR